MKPPPEPESDTHVLIQQFWVAAGELERIDPEGKTMFLFSRNFCFEAKHDLAMMNKYPRFLNSFMMHKKILWLNFFYWAIDVSTFLRFSLHFLWLKKFNLTL